MSASFIKNQLHRQNIQVTANRDGGRSYGSSDMDRSGETNRQENNPRTISDQHWRGRGSRRPFRGRGGSWFDHDRRDGVSITERLGEQMGFKGRRQPRGGRGGHHGNRHWVSDAVRGDPNKLSWYKVTIPFGIKAEKDFILNSINELLEVPFQPHQFHYERDNDAAFYLNTNTTGADSLKALNRRITLPTGFKMMITVKPIAEPPPLREVDETVVSKLKVTMSNKYDVEHKLLDMSSFYSNPEMKAESLFLPLNRANIMNAVIKIVEENIPELVALNLSGNRLMSLDGLALLTSKTPSLTSLDLSNNELKGDWELDKIKGWQLLELNVSANPFVTRLGSDRTALVSAVRKRFPKVLKLNNEVLPPPIRFDVEDITSLPKSLGSSITLTQPPAVQELLARFLQQFFEIFDSPKRDPLSAAYHDEACFSYAVTFSRVFSGKQPTFQDIHESRNMMRVKDDGRRLKLLRQGKFAILAFFSTFPQTSHWLHTFNVDVLHASQTTLIFTVSGLFEELNSMSSSTATSAPQAVRAFSRMFVTVPQGAGIVIANEQLSLTNASIEQIIKANASKPLAAAVATAASPAATALTAVSTSSSAEVMEAMVTEFSSKSGMNRHWSKECLVHNGWDFAKAATVFYELKAHGKIPAEAFSSNAIA